MYLALEVAYKSGKLPNCITPQCYGAYENDGVDVLILDLCLCNGIFDQWSELTASEP